MKHQLYKTFLFFLRALVYLKRAFFSLLKISKPTFSFLEKIYRETLGFWIYRFLFGIKRKAGKLRTPVGGWLSHFFGERSTLQVVLLTVAFIVMIPHSVLYTKENNTIAGRQSSLYALVGAGEQDFDLQEISVDVASIQTPQDARSWNAAAVAIEAGSTPQEFILEKEGISGITAGGGAIAKPNIISGAEVPTIETKRETGRTEILDYEVQPGDVISTIAQKFNLNTLTILWANNLTSRSYIRPGDKLRIMPTDGVLHKVASGDTISKIATKYDAKSSDIVSYNKLADASDIVIGEELIVPGGTKPSTVYTAVSSQTVFRQVAAPPPSVNSPAGSEFLWPSTARRITQYFGLQHTGLDIAGPIGTPLYASKSGTVIKSQCGWNGGYGCYVILDHGGGVTTLYGHNSQLLVSAGESVVQGQTIALMGSTGRSTGSHIHFEVRVNGIRQNPLKYIR